MNVTNFLKICIIPTRKTSSSLVIYHIRRVSRNLFLGSMVFVFLTCSLFWYFDEYNFIGKIFIIIGSSYFIFIAFSALSVLISPARHSAYKYISRFGNPQRVSDSIEEELKEILRISKAIFTKSWFLSVSFYSFNILMLGEIIWAHEKATTHWIIFIPFRVKREVVIFSKTYKTPVEIPCNKKEVEALLNHLKMRLPWILEGYSEKLKNLWETAPATFIKYATEQQAQFIEEYKKEKRF
jgi:hypothetical protein